MYPKSDKGRKPFIFFILKIKTKNMENQTANEELAVPTLLDALTRPLSPHFGYTLASFLIVYIYACTVLFM